MILQGKYQQTVFALRFYESLASNFFTLLFVSMLNCYSMIFSVIVKLSSPFPYSFTHSPWKQSFKPNFHFSISVLNFYLSFLTLRPDQSSMEKVSALTCTKLSLVLSIGFCGEFSLGRYLVLWHLIFNSMVLILL